VQTLSIIELSMSIDDDFFSVAITIPLVATVDREELRVRTRSGRIRQDFSSNNGKKQSGSGIRSVETCSTFDTEASRALRNSSQSVLDLDELSRRREDGQRVAVRASIRCHVDACGELVVE
jgi:hypothetical protein